MNAIVIAAIVTAAASVLVASIGAIIKQRSDRRSTALANRLAWVSRQLTELYGPMFALVSATDGVWSEFRRKYRPQGAFWGEPEPTPEEEKAWREWIVEVFMPTNRRIRDLVLEHTDLLIDDEMPECLITLAAHVSGYEVFLQQWQSGDFTEKTSVVNYPGPELRAYAERSYSELKREQRNLLAGLAP
jgi:hypothetical protein